ncbi:hypothetical protein SUGI_0906210 [Cryptomeria japonica]|nr:hypothetical protein SUGI_0906210 [Cryptomeria japonica]
MPRVAIADLKSRFVDIYTMARTGGWISRLIDISTMQGRSGLLPHREKGWGTWGVREREESSRIIIIIIFFFSSRLGADLQGISPRQGKMLFGYSVMREKVLPVGG